MAIYSLNILLVSGFRSHIVQSLRESGPVAIIVLLIIAILSIISWAIMGKKWLTLRKIARDNKIFQADFEQAGKDLNKAVQSARAHKNSALARIFLEGYQELRTLSSIEEGKIIFSSGVISIIARSLDNAISAETRHLDDRLVILATTANICPFLGLFGTVWGILDTFRSMGLVGDASLSTVAPGISEALITTIAGLAAAIPAAAAYNLFHSKINRMITEMEDFSSHFLGLLERSLLFQEKSSKE